MIARPPSLPTFARRCSRRELLFGVTALGTTALVAAPAGAEPEAEVSRFTPDERARLLSHGEVRRRFTFTHGRRSYLGALSYSGIAREAATVLSTLQDMDHLPRALPATRETFFPNPNDRQALRVVHGTFLVNGGYTLSWNPQPSQNLIRFWLDRSQPADVEDVFGFFRVEAYGPQQSILTVAVAVDPGEGLLAAMFRGKIHDFMSRPARYIKNYIHRHVPVGRHTVASGT